MLGIATDRDITVRSVARGQSIAAEVSSVTTKHPVTIQGSADISAAFQVLKDAGVRRLPVLEDTDLAGIITVDDLLVALALGFAAAISPVVHELVNSQISS